MPAGLARGLVLAGFAGLQVQFLRLPSVAPSTRVAAFCVSIALWLGLAGSRSKLGAFLAGFWFFCCCFYLGYAAFSGAAPSLDVLWLFLSSPSYALMLFRQSGPLGALFPALLLVAAGFVYVLRGANWRATRWTWALGVAGALLLARDARATWPADLDSLRVLYTLGREARTMAERVPPDAGERTRLHPVRAPGRAVVWLVHESMRADVPPPGQFHTRERMYFANAFAQSTQTPVSVPSMLTGLAPDASREVYARAPFAWHHFDEDGASSVFVSPQLYSWANLRSFYFGHRPPLYLRTAEDMRSKAINDGGKPDSEAVNLALELANKVWNEQRELYLFVQFNGTHLPCWHPGVERPGASRYEASPERAARCHQAEAYVQSEVERLLEGLQQRGILEQAWVVSTSDHSEVADDAPPGRAFDVSREFAHVPMWIMPPTAWMNAHPVQTAQLRRNTSQAVGNVDLLPTLLDAFSLPPPAYTAGQSLLREVPADRALRSCIGVPLRAWDPSKCENLR